MGLGGNLMWTGVIAALARDRRPLVLAMQPKLTDLLAGRDHDRSANLSADPVFRGNPHIAFTPYRPKGTFARRVDNLFMAVLERLGLRRRFERMLAARAHARPGPLMLHVDMEIHSYADAQVGPPERRHFRWKDGGHAIRTMLAGFAPGRAEAPPEIHLDDTDCARAKTLLDEMRIDDGFIAIEPETNPEFFGDLRAWPFERWQAVVTALAGEGHRVAQVGLPGGRALEGAVDLRGRTDFRAACAILARARLFLGTESGLMHAARAVDTDAVIVWGGVTLPEFAGYPDQHDIVCHRVACAPCGNLGWCDNKRICMLDIDTAEVLARIRARLAKS
ncbi:MAG: hypothetical protein GC202_11980 [Alphaproteobacteria bacterium]|nr:hypothetical protein [Alphaproteobacteria bacterium]